jgi:hypothetical protein
MKRSDKRAGNIGIIARAVGVLVLAVIVMGASVTPVLARGGEGHHGYGKHYKHGRYYRHGHYAAPVHVAPVYYAPPPVVYAPPPPPPGISVVFPITIR